MSNSVKLLRKRLAEILVKHGEIAALARHSGINRATVDKWVAGESVPNLAFLDALADGLGTTPWELIKPDNVELSLYAALTPPIARQCADIVAKMSPIAQETAKEALEAILKIDIAVRHPSKK